MAIRNELRNIELVQESTFGTDPGAGYVRVYNARAIDVQVDQKPLKRPIQISTLTLPDHVMGVKRASLSFKWEITGGRTANPVTGDTATASELHELFKSIWISQQGTSKAYASGGASAQSDVVVAAGGANDFKIGQRIWDTQNGQQRIVANWVNGTRTLTANAPWTTSITGGVIASAWTYEQQTVAATVKSLTCRASIDSIDYVLKGGRVSKIALAATQAGEIPMLDVEIEFADWTTDAFTATAANTLPAPAVMRGSPFWIGAAPVAATSYIDRLAFDFGTPIVHQRASEGSQGVVGVEYAEPGPKGSFSVYYASVVRDDWAAGTKRALWLPAGANAYSGFGLWVPQAQYDKHQHGDLDKLGVQMMGFEAKDNGTTSAPWVFSVAG